MTDFNAQLDSLFSVDPEPAFNAESQPGDTVSGFVETIRLAQAFDPETRRPAIWDDGRPQMQLILIIETDNGELRTIYIKTWGVQRKALALAVKNAGGRKVTDVISEGSQFRATFTGTEKAKDRTHDDTKLYEYEIS